MVLKPPPLVDWPHNGKSVTLSGCVVGGVVYRGTRYPELEGHYVFGENSFGELYSMAFDGEKLTHKTTLVKGLGVHQDNAVSAFAIDNRGEIYVTLFHRENSSIKRLQRAGTTSLPSRNISDRSLLLKLQSLGNGQMAMLLPGDAQYQIEIRNALGSLIWGGKGQGYYRYASNKLQAGLLTVTARSKNHLYSARYLNHREN